MSEFAEYSALVHVTLFGVRGLKRSWEKHIAWLGEDDALQRMLVARLINYLQHVLQVEVLSGVTSDLEHEITEYCPLHWSRTTVHTTWDNA